MDIFKTGMGLAMIIIGGGVLFAYALITLSSLMPMSKAFGIVVTCTCLLFFGSLLKEKK